MSVIVTTTQQQQPQQQQQQQQQPTQQPQQPTQQQQQRIVLKIKDQQGNEVRFSLNKSTPLRKLTNAYYSRLGPQALSVLFIVDGVSFLVARPEHVAEENVFLFDEPRFLHGFLAASQVMLTVGILQGVLGSSSFGVRWLIWALGLDT